MPEMSEKQKERIRQNALQQIKKFVVGEPVVEQVNWDGLKKLKEIRNNRPYFYDRTKFWVNLSSGVLNMSRISKSLKNPTTLLFYILQWKTWKDADGNIKDKKAREWYKAGFIISSRSQEQMSLDLGVSERTIVRWVKALVQDRLIVVEKLGLENIYVVGLVDNDGVERYFYDGGIPVYK